MSDKLGIPALYRSAPMSQICVRNHRRHIRKLAYRLQIKVELSIWTSVYFSSKFRILYKITVFDFGETEMETSEWVARCSARLHAQWPRLHREQRDEVAKDLWNDQRWQQSEPEVAVVEWLRQGIPVPIGSEQQ